MVEVMVLQVILEMVEQADQVVAQLVDFPELVVVMALVIKDNLAHQLFHRHILTLVVVEVVLGMLETPLQVMVEKD
jgi:hypothetical protein